MKLGKLIGRIGFVIGFLGPILYYPAVSTQPFIGPFCPACGCIFTINTGPLLWVEIGLVLGFVQGVAFALLGFTVGFVFTAKISRSDTEVPASGSR